MVLLKAQSVAMEAIYAHINGKSYKMMMIELHNKVLSPERIKHQLNSC